MVLSYGSDSRDEPFCELEPFIFVIQNKVITFFVLSKFQFFQIPKELLDTVKLI